eukprot:scaffold2177_cov272-Pinguiococcus_pyrenoidosus.AAC.17
MAARGTGSPRRRPAPTRAVALSLDQCHPQLVPGKPLRGRRSWRLYCPSRGQCRSPPPLAPAPEAAGSASLRRRGTRGRPRARPTASRAAASSRTLSQPLWHRQRTAASWLKIRFLQHGEERVLPTGVELRPLGHVDVELSDVQQALLELVDVRAMQQFQRHRDSEVIPQRQQLQLHGGVLVVRKAIVGRAGVSEVAREDARLTAAAARRPGYYSVRGSGEAAALLGLSGQRVPVAVEQHDPRPLRPGLVLAEVVHLVSAIPEIRQAELADDFVGASAAIDEGTIRRVARASPLATQALLEVLILALRTRR